MEKEGETKVSTDWRSRLKRMSFALLMIFLFFTAVFYWLSMGMMLTYYDDFEDDSYNWADDQGCEDWACSPFNYCGSNESIGIVTLYGGIDTYMNDEWSTSSDIVLSQIDAFERDSQFDTIILLIDSYGGYMVPSEEIANALKRSEKETVAVIREEGLSGGYMAATGADTIYASRFSSVGSIGVTMSYLDYSEQRRKEGVRYLNISSGRFKDAGDPDRPLDEEEREYLFGIVKDTHEIMVKMVAENRGLDIEDVRTVSDGKMILGDDAMEQGLIDKIGGLHDALGDMDKSIEDACELYYIY
ncbi:MAG: S49 family peptidase [Patescibacteria group bacterium]